MTSKGLGEMFEGDSADICAGQFLLVSMGSQAEGLACADPGARTPILYPPTLVISIFRTNNKITVHTGNEKLKPQKMQR
jgi:hypothetical protein